MMNNVYDRLRPMGRILNLNDEGWIVWDCSPIYGPDGRVHVFAVRWRRESPDSHNINWFCGSQIVHAVAENPTGPYEIKDVVIEGDGTDTRWNSAGVMNPKIYKIDGTYVLLYAGTSKPDIEVRSFGMLLSDSLDGPWKDASDNPILTSSAAEDGFLRLNPALAVHPNGQFYLYYRKTPVVTNNDGEENEGAYGRFKVLSEDWVVGLAIADSLTGPYRVHSEPVLEFENRRRIGEDPYVWHDGKCFWMLVHNLCGRHSQTLGSLFSSTDGWTWSKAEKGYPNPLNFLGAFRRLEEPNLLFSEEGKPTHLFNFMGPCPEDNAYSGFVFEIAD